ncbi:hypothetical protein [Jiangella sp. DSM 45060]|uniref:hypothetical protein n=1 Tax=Jiangella sp. DSM 45060 TaxID=1798224 RepID=UPI00087B9992|nr:hypothetical protein [Jiangella sp. DSM 45060]SDT23057.1 hypothetical protein SAMN04515669_3184 [Jiangella sp. DSM 45060]
MNEFDDLESALAAELRRRSGDVLATPGLAGRARRRARVVRRRRVAAAGAVAAAVLAVAVPTALSLRSVPQTAPPADSPTTPSEVHETETPERGGTTALALDGLPGGPEPSIGWFEGPDYHGADGRSAQFPSMWMDTLELGDRFMASTGDEVSRLAADGEVLATFTGAGPVLSADGRLVAYFNRDEDVVRAEPADGGEAEPGRDVPEDRWLEPVGFLGDHRLVSNLRDATGAPAGFRIDDFGAPDGGAATAPWDLVSVSAVSEAAGLVTGPTTELTEDGGCWAVYETDASTPLWTTCAYSFLRFSPDGRHLVGTAGHPHAEAFTTTVLVDALTGAVVHQYTGRHIYEAMFEDEGHLILSVALEDGDSREAALLRCDFTGSCERTTPIVHVSLQGGYTYGLALPRW